MADDSSKNADKTKRTIKIIPRNLTACAAYPVPGNPAISRPESGVEVSFPGLEIDQRALEQRFFPGLYFEFQREDGAILADVDLKPNQLASGLSRSDLSPLRPIFLLGILYKVKSTDKEPQFFSFHRLRGQDVGPRIRDLLPERVAIIFGPSWEAAMAGPFSQSPLLLDVRLNQMENAFKAVNDAEKFKVYRNNNGQLVCGVFSDNRTTYLNEYGVIDPAIFPPGDLTKSLCAPWIYDFRDCLCFYWASNKPDITDGTEPPFLNYLRDRKINPPSPPTANYHQWVGGRIAEGFLMSGEWRKLPIVINDREERRVLRVEGDNMPKAPHPFALLDPDFNRDNIINELKYLATVEHALIVEYLFAHYSLDASPPREGETLDDRKKIIFGVADDLLKIAIDEMHHFLWVNQLLRLLGCKEPVTDRAEVIGLPPDDDHIFKRKVLPGFTYMNRDVSLRILNFPVLEEFIEIEANSRNIDRGGTSFGMYVQLLRSLMQGDAELADSDHAVKLVKLLIDEGDQHGVTFQSMKRRLESVGEPFSRELSLNDTDDPRILSKLNLGEFYYHKLLAFIHMSYALRERAGGTLIDQAVEQMRLLHDLGHELARENVGLRFTEPKRADFRVPRDIEDALRLLKEYENELDARFREVEETGDDQSKSLAARQRKTSKKLYRQMRRTIEEDQ